MLRIAIRIWVATKYLLGDRLREEGGSAWNINTMDGGNLKAMDGTYVVQKERS